MGLFGAFAGLVGREKTLAFPGKFSAIYPLVGREKTLAFTYCTPNCSLYPF